MSPEEIARVCHEANRAYCAVHGDLSQLPWRRAPKLIRNSAISGVNEVLSHPDRTPEESHESWMRYKLEEGWVYGEEKSITRRTHPDLVPYDKLPEVERHKDELFIGIVRALS